MNKMAKEREGPPGLGTVGQEENVIGRETVPGGLLATRPTVSGSLLLPYHA